MTFQQQKLSEGWVGCSNTTTTGNIAAESYKLATLHFDSELTRDKRKVDFAKQSATLQGLEDVVKTARDNYASSRNKKASKWLERFSSRLMYYGNIFDVLSQHHPEYVALAWGAMKFLFVASLNHEGVITSIAKGLACIADTLPRIELATILYPTPRMTDAVEGLYAHIIRFSIRAHDWYREGTLRHIVHSVTRPADLRYHDVLENIQAGSRNIEQLAIAGSQVELRQMHTILKLMAGRVERSESTILEMRCMMINHQAINSSSLVDTNQKVSDLQFSEMVRIAAELSSFDPLESYNQAVIVRNLRQRNQRVNVSSAFWQSPTLKKFAECPKSSLMLVKGTFQERGALRDAAVRVTEELRNLNITTIWAVRAQISDRATNTPSPLDVLKSLVAQALTTSGSAHSQKSTALSCTQLRTAATAKEWLEILGAALAEVCREIYIVLELDMLISSLSAPSSTDEIIALFNNLLEELTNRGKKSIVKVLIVTSRPWKPLPQATNVFVETMLTGRFPRAKPPSKDRRKQVGTSSYRTVLRTRRR